MPVQVNPFLSYESPYPDKTLVMTGEGFQQMLNFLDRSPVLVFDHETSGLEWFKDASSCGLALAGWDQSSGRVHSYYVPYRHRTGEPQLDLSVVGPALSQLLADDRRTKIAHNLKFDEHFSRREGWQVRGPRYDTMIGARLYDENRPLALKTRAFQDLGRNDADEWETKVEREVVRLAKIHRMKKGEYKSRYGYSQVAIPIAGIYACLDVEFTLGLYSLYERAEISSTYPRIWSTEMRLTEVLCDMEEAGLPIDVDYLGVLRDSLHGVKTGLEMEIERLLGREINLGSDDALRDLLINVLGLKLTKLTKAKQLSVDREVLESFQSCNPVIKLIMDWRDAEKLYSTYTLSILKRLDSRNLLHADFQQVGTDTGRLSCRQPNFQNMPTDDDDRAEKYSGKDLEHGGIDPWSIRRAFVGRGNGWVRLFYDYSQIELRVLAYYSKDPVMVDNYVRGGDIHERTSLEVFGSKEKRHRRISKVINFGLSYCMTAMGLSRQAKISYDDAERFLSVFFQRYQGVTDFRKRFWAQVRSQNCRFQNIFGRPRRIPYMDSPNDYHRGRGERQAIATLIQGTAAELTKESLVRVHRRLKDEGLSAQIVNTVHDEIQVDCPVEELVSVSGVMKEEMERFPEFDPIPVVVDGDYSTQSWADKKGLPV